MSDVSHNPTRCSVVVGEVLDALTAEVIRLKAEITTKDAIIVKFTKELHDTERFLDWLKASEKIGTWCKQQVEHRAKGVRAALAAEGGAK